MLEFVCEVIRNECQYHIVTGGQSVGLSASLVWTVRYLSHGPETPSLTNWWPCTLSKFPAGFMYLFILFIYFIYLFILLIHFIYLFYLFILLIYFIN